MAIGENIKKLRRARGWTQAQLAQATGLSRSYISGIEEGKQWPRLRTLEVIAAALGVGLEELFKNS